jgi:hypothetical protein
LVAEGSPDVQTAGNFFNFLAGVFSAFSSEVATGLRQENGPNQ